MNYAAAAATIAALTMSVFAALPASAFACGGFCGGGNDTDINNSVTINVSNSGTVYSNTSAKADTGDNTAQGSTGGDAGKGGSGGDGGEAEVKDGHGCDCDPTVGSATGGNGGNGGAGGNGGDAGPGGLVDTGDATANAGSLNTLNSTEIDVQAADCGCSSTSHSSGWGRRGDTDINNKVKVTVNNDGHIDSTTKAKVETGDNTAEGSYGGDGKKGGSGGDGGEAETHGGALNWDGNPVGGDAYGGAGGNGGAGGDGGRGDVGGTIRTGAGESNAGSINLMNSTIVRVTR